jgi:hypothetical protein
MTDAVSLVAAVPDGGLPEYPLTRDDRLDSHFFMAWERSRWLNSDMRMKGQPECRALYFDLICVSYEQSPIGTLPTDMSTLAKFAHVDRDRFEALCAQPYGPLHNWVQCICEGGEVRLMHWFVLRSLQDAVARKADNQARNEAGNRSKRIQRLRSTIMGYHADLAKNDAATLWMDGWLEERTQYRNAQWIERAIQAWSERALDRNMRG